MTTYLITAWSRDLERFVSEPAGSHDSAARVADRLATGHGVAFVFRRFGDRVAHLADWWSADERPGERAVDATALRVTRTHAAWTAAAYWRLPTEVERLATEHAQAVGRKERVA